MANLDQKAANAVAQQKHAQGQGPSLQQFLNQPWVGEQIQRQLGARGDGNAFVRSILTAIQNAPDLAQCEPTTVLGGMFLAAQLNLEVGAGLGQAFLIPRRDKKSKTGWTASLQLGYPGLIKLASNSGQVVGFDTIVVREGDRFTKGASSERGKFFDMEYGARNEDPTAQIQRVIGLVWLQGSPRPQWRDLTIDQIEARRPDYTKEQQGQNGAYVPNTPWRDHYAAMCEKTAMIEALRFVPKSSALQLAIASDDQVLTKTERGDLTLRREDARPEALPDRQEPAGEPVTYQATPTPQNAAPTPPQPTQTVPEPDPASPQGAEAEEYAAWLATQDENAPQEPDGGFWQHDEEAKF